MAWLSAPRVGWSRLDTRAWESPERSHPVRGGHGGAGIQPARPNGAPSAVQVAKRRAPVPGYEDDAGTTFDIPFSATPATDGETTVVFGDLVASDRIDVWTGACRESSPVQCAVEAVTDAP